MFQRAVIIDASWSEVLLTRFFIVSSKLCFLTSLVWVARHYQHSPMMDPVPDAGSGAVAPVVAAVVERHKTEQQHQQQQQHQIMVNKQRVRASCSRSQLFGVSTIRGSFLLLRAWGRGIWCASRYFIFWEIMYIGFRILAGACRPSEYICEHTNATYMHTLRGLYRERYCSAWPS